MPEYPGTSLRVSPGLSWVAKPPRSCGEGTRVQASSMLYFSCLMLFNCVTYPTGSPTQLKQSAVRLETQTSKYKQANQGIVRLEVSSFAHDGERSF